MSLASFGGGPTKLDIVSTNGVLIEEKGVSCLTRLHKAFVRLGAWSRWWWFSLLLLPTAHLHTLTASTPVLYRETSTDRTAPFAARIGRFSEATYINFASCAFYVRPHRPSRATTAKMKITTPRHILTPLVALLAAAIPQAICAASAGDTLQHVYVVGPDPSGRATIGKALTRLGYVSTNSGDITLTTTGSGSEGTGFSYTEISTMLGEDDEGVGEPARANYIVARQAPGANQTMALARGAGVEKDDDSTGAWWRRMVGFPAAAESEARELLELSIDVSVEARGLQAEKWVALCDFLGLGYSTVERLDLWQFP